MRPSLFRRAIAIWLPIACASSVLAMTIYVGVQQGQRSDANDPQLQLARDAASEIAAGTPANQVVIGPSVDVSTSLAPWLTVYGGDGAVLASTGTIEGHAPVIPDAARTDAQTGERTFTWEPRDGLRFATVAEPTTGGTVVAARSMAEIESRESQTLMLAGLGWLAALAAAAVGTVAGVWFRDHQADPSPH
jgi:hypothetical protein